MVNNIRTELDAFILPELISLTNVPPLQNAAQLSVDDMPEAFGRDAFLRDLMTSSAAPIAITHAPVKTLPQPPATQAADHPVKSVETPPVAPTVSVPPPPAPVRIAKKRVRVQHPTTLSKEQIAKCLEIIHSPRSPAYRQMNAKVLLYFFSGGARVCDRAMPSHLRKTHAVHRLLTRFLQKGFEAALTTKCAVFVLGEDAITELGCIACSSQEPLHKKLNAEVLVACTGVDSIEHIGAVLHVHPNIARLVKHTCLEDGWQKALTIPTVPLFHDVSQ